MLVHTFFKEKDSYKVKMFLNIKAMFKDPVKIMEDIIEKYEKENNCSLGDNRELKLLNLPDCYLKQNEILVHEEVLDDKNFIEELIQSQQIVEI